MTSAPATVSEERLRKLARLLNWAVVMLDMPEDMAPETMPDGYAENFYAAQSLALDVLHETAARANMESKMSKEPASFTGAADKTVIASVGKVRPSSPPSAAVTAEERARNILDTHYDGVRDKALSSTLPYTTLLPSAELRRLAVEQIHAAEQAAREGEHERDLADQHALARLVERREAEIREEKAAREAADARIGELMRDNDRQRDILREIGDALDEPGCSLLFRDLPARLRARLAAQPAEKRSAEDVIDGVLDLAVECATNDQPFESEAVSAKIAAALREAKLLNEEGR